MKNLRQKEDVATNLQYRDLKSSIVFAMKILKNSDFLIMNFYLSHFPKTISSVVKPLCPTTLDDSFTMKRQAPKRQIQTLAVWTQLTIRHIYGKHSWLMRGLIETLEDFNASGNFIFISRLLL